jgi:hypothetical protein
MQLRGLSIRTVLRGFDSGEVDDELKSGIVLLYAADYLFYWHIDPDVE